MFNEGFDFDFRKPVVCNEKMVSFLSCSFMLSASMLAAVELDLFSRIEEGIDQAEGLAQACRIPVREMEKLLTFCVSLGLLARHDGRCVNDPAARALLVESSERNIIPVMMHYKKHVYGLFGNLNASLKDGRNRTADWQFSGETGTDQEMYGEMDARPEEYHRFIRAMNTFSQGVGAAIARDVDLSNVTSMVDLGCGGGQVAVELAKDIEHLRITMVDKDNALVVARENVAKGGLGGRVECMCGDILKPLDLPPASVDAVLISAVLGDWDKASQLAILDNARHVLKPGGMLLVSETLLHDDGSGPLLPALLSLYVLVLTQGGKNFKASELRELLEEAQFESIVVKDYKDQGLRDLVLASKKTLA